MKCLNCGQDIPEGRKFCSSSCSAKYNNVRRQRHPWTEEQKRKIRGKQVDQVCRYCNTLTGKKVLSGRALGVCDVCRPFAGRKKFFEKLGLEKGNLQERNVRLVQILYTQYFEQKKSIPQIAKELNYRNRSVERIFEEQGWSRRTRSDSQKETYLQGRPVSSSESYRFKQGYHTSWEGFQFWYRSSYELEFAKKLDEQQIPYRIEAKEARTEYVDRSGKKHVAVPDFYLPETKEIVEVKSSYTLGDLSTMKLKFEAYRQKGFIPKLWLNFSFVDLELLSSSNG